MLDDEVAQSLLRHGRPVTTVFELLGGTENDLTAALGFVLTRSQKFRARLCALLAPGKTGEAAVALEVRDEAGRTDLELTFDGYTVVIEAKRGWLLPTPKQLARYAPRISAVGGGQLVTLSDCSPQWAAHVLPAEVGGVSVTHLPWSVVLTELAAARSSSRGTERLWLEELDSYLRRLVTVARDPSEAWVYSVSLARRLLPGTDRTLLQFVIENNVYFHPYGPRWPKRAPIFFGFRWGGKLQRVSRVLHTEVVPRLTDWLPSAEPTEEANRPHAIHELGSPLSVPVLANGNLGRNDRRLWVLLDRLLESDTLVDAEKQSKALTQPIAKPAPKQPKTSSETNG